MHRIGFAGLVAALLLTAPGFAEEGEIGWRMKSENFVAVDGTDAGKDADYYSYVRIIEAGTGGEPLLSISCQLTTRGKYTMNMGLQLDPENTFEDNPTRKHNIVNRSGRLFIGEKSKMERWYYHPGSTKILPVSRKAVKRVFNGAVRGDVVRVKTTEGNHTIQMPPQNAAFKEFAKICPSTNGGKIDLSIFDKISETVQISD